jgi:phage-related minor tail protein
MFAFASGAGLMGEAGPEAILPLKRGSDGKLGVQAGGTSGGISVSTTVNIDSSGSATSDTNSQSAAGRQIGDMLNAKIKDSLIKEQRPGGILWRMAHP